MAFYFIFFSCKKEKNSPSQSQKIGNIEEINLNQKKDSDTISYELWHATTALLPENEIPRVDKLDEMEILFENRTKKIKDTLLSSVELSLSNKRLEKDGNMLKLKEALVQGNTNLYCQSILDIPLGKNPYMYSLYMGEKYNFGPAFNDVYLYITRVGLYRFRTKYKEWKTFDYEKSLLLRGGSENFNFVTQDEKYLYFYSLIKAYKKGDIYLSQTLGRYFREGLYFPKDTETADKLDSIYENRQPVKTKTE